MKFKDIDRLLNNKSCWFPKCKETKKNITEIVRKIKDKFFQTN